MFNTYGFNEVEFNAEAEGDIEGSVCPRGTTYTAVTGSAVPRATTYTAITGSAVPRASSDFLEASTVPRGTSYTACAQSVRPRGTTWSARLPLPIPPVTPSTPSPAPTAPSDFTCQMVVVTPDGSFTVPFGDTYDFTEQVSQTSEFTFSTVDDDRLLNPENPGTWNGRLDDRAYDDDGAYAKKVYVSGTLGGVPWEFPPCIPTKYGYGLRAGDPDDTFTWAGRGVAAKGYDDEADQTSMVSTSSLPVYARDVVADIASALGLSIDTSGLYPNFKVARINKQQQQGLAYLEQILDVLQAVWTEQHGQIVVQVPDYTSSPHRAYDNRYNLNIRSLGTDASHVQTYTTVIAQRADDMGGVVASADQQGAAFGQIYSATFEQPVPIVGLNIRAKLELGGSLEDFYFYRGTDAGAGGSLPAAVMRVRVGTTPPPVIGGPNVQSVKYGFGANVTTPVGVTSGSFKMEIRSQELNVYADGDTTVTVTDGSSTGRGRRTKRIGPNPIICDVGTLTRWATAVLWKAARRAQKWTGEVDFDPWLHPAMRVNFYDSKFDRNHLIWLQRVSHRLGNGGFMSRVTQWEGVEYVP